MVKLGWVLLFLMTSVSAEGKPKKQEEGFPDYNRLEYAKPLPPVDEQVPQPKPGSIQMRVGQKNKTTDSMPLDEIPVSLLQKDRQPDESEPPMAGFFDEHTVVPSTTAVAPAVSN